MSNHIVDFLQTVIGKPAEGPSPAGNWLGGILKEAKEGEITVDFVIREEMCNPVGTIHGGMLSLMADEVIGMTTFSLNTEYLYTSVNLVVDFLSNVRQGETVSVKAEVVRKGRNIINVSCFITSETGKLLAKVTSNMGKTQNKIGI